MPRWRVGDETAGYQALILEGGRKRNNGYGALPEDERILQRHGFLLEKWRSVYGCFKTRVDLHRHRQSGSCPSKVLLSVNDNMAHRYNSIRDINTMLLAEGDVAVKIVAAEWYCENVRYFDMRKLSRQDDPHQNPRGVRHFGLCKACFEASDGQVLQLNMLGPGGAPTRESGLRHHYFRSHRGQQAEMQGKPMPMTLEQLEAWAEDNKDKLPEGGHGIKTTIGTLRAAAQSTAAYPSTPSVALDKVIDLIGSP